MTVYIKQSGAWVAASEGGISIKWGGVWRRASTVHIKSGGAWRDSGYRGAPNAPGALWIHSWDFNQVTIGFSGPSGGISPVAYEVLQTGATGDHITSVEVSGSPSSSFSVTQDTRYKFYVRSKSAAGLWSAYTESLNVQIGHPEEGYWADQGRTRPWSSEHISGGRNRDEAFQVYAPPNVIIEGYHWRNLRTPQSSVVSPWNDWPKRQVNFLLPWTTGEITSSGYIASGHNLDMALNIQGDETFWGFVPRDEGWAAAATGTYGNSYYMLFCDDFWLSGSEIYFESVYFVTRSYQGNGYW